MDDNGQETVRQGAASHGTISGRRASEIGGSPLRFLGVRDRNHGSLALASFDPAQFPNIGAGDSPRGGEEEADHRQQTIRRQRHDLGVAWRRVFCD